MKLVIAEKPSMARAIKDVVGREYEVTNAFGHILELAEPDAYLPADVPVSIKTGRKIWRACDLPILPAEWRQIPIRSSKDQLIKIGELLKKADLVVNAGDPDREGQLLIDEILDHFRYRGRVERVWLSALDKTSIDKAFRDLRDNRSYKPLSDAAMGRSRADWLVGMNLTRAATLSSGSFYSIGRVQTPTLALVVHRDLAIERFAARDYFEVRARIRHERGTFSALWKPSDPSGPGFDEEGRLTDRRQAEALSLKGKGAGKISRYEKKEESKSAPLPYSLSALQKVGSGRFGLSADEVLKTCQSLYEKKVTSYPRTDCRFLPVEQFSEAERILQALPVSPDIRPLISASRKHPAWNTAKVTAHPAIVPTGERAGDLSEKERKIYDMIVSSYLALFLPDHRYFSAALSVEMNREIWTATGRQEIDPGWTRLFGRGDREEGGEEDLPSLPECRPGEAVLGEGGEVREKKTRPPGRFTDGTLIEAMSNIHKFVEDPEAKQTLKETSGIGTEATRAGILETLVGREYIVRKGKQILSTEKGRSLVGFLEATLPDLVDPVTTARWEDDLSEVSAGKKRVEAFVGGIADLVREQTRTLLTKGQGGLAGDPSSPAKIACPVCGGQALVTRRESRNKKGVFFWTCSQKTAAGEPVHPPLTDVAGTPGAPFSEKPPLNSDGPPCPTCRKPLSAETTSKGTAYFRCAEGHGPWWSDNGSPGNPWKPQSGTESAKGSFKKSGKGAKTGRRS